MTRNASVRTFLVVVLLSAASGLSYDGRGGASLGARAEARSCQGGDFCIGSCPVKFEWPWDGAWCAGGARSSGFETYHQEGRCAHVNRTNHIGAYICLAANVSISIAGCNVSVGDIPGGVACLWTKAEADLKAKLRVNVLGCDLSIADPAGSFQCLKDKAIEEFKKGAGGLLALIEQARPVIECAGVGDLVKLSDDFFRSPAIAIQKTHAAVTTFVAGLSGKIARNGMALGAQLLSLVSGTTITGPALDQVMAFLWSTGEEMSKFSGPMRCLMNVLRQHKAVIEPVARGMISGFLNGIPAVVSLASSLLGEKAGAAILDKVMAAILGDARAARMKTYIAQNLRNDMEDHAASLLGSALDAIRNKAPNVKKLWLDARAAIHGTDGDFGVRKILLTLSAVVEQLAGFLVDELALELVKWLIRTVDTGVVNIGNRLLDGLCGLIPEVGAAICTATGALAVRGTWNMIGQPVVDKVLTPILQKALAFLPSLIAKQVTRLVANKLSGVLMKPIDNAVATNTPAAWASKAVSPFVNFFIKIVESSFLPGVKRSLAYSSKLAELGDMAVAMALKENLPARQALPVVALSGSLPLMPIQMAEIPRVAGPSESFIAASAAAANPHVQTGWRWCDKCQAMIYGGAASIGRCAAGGDHNRAGGNYRMPLATPQSEGQNNWRYCFKCQALVYGGTAGKHPCPNGGTHTTAGSAEYQVPNQRAAKPGEQNSWRYCSKCSGLYHRGLGNGRCAAGGAHAEGSVYYILTYQ